MIETNTAQQTSSEIMRALRPAEPVANISNTEAALRGLAKAVERLRKLEQDADCAFTDFEQARERANEVGVVAAVELEPGISAAFSSWKTARAKTQVAGVGSEMVRGPDGWHVIDLADTAT